MGAFTSSALTYLELPLYMFLGCLCGIASFAFTRMREFVKPLFDNLAVAGVAREFHPLVASFCVAFAAGGLGMPELLYRGFDNVNVIFAETSSFAPTRLLSDVFGKIVLTGICTGSGLVGGVFAPSFFIGASGGAFYGQCVEALAKLVGWTVSPAQDYASVGAAAALAGICGVPLTAVVLLLELTAGRDYAICLPLIAAVGLSVYTEQALLRGNIESIKVQDVSQDALAKVAMVEAEPDEIFQFLDKNQDGTVTKEEFREWFTTLGVRTRTMLSNKKKPEVEKQVAGKGVETQEVATAAEPPKRAGS